MLFSFVMRVQCMVMSLVGRVVDAVGARRARKYAQFFAPIAPECTCIEFFTLGRHTVECEGRNDVFGRLTHQSLLEIADDVPMYYRDVTC